MITLNQSVVDAKGTLSKGGPEGGRCCDSCSEFALTWQAALVHDDQDGAELFAELVEDLPQLRFGVGKLLVEDLLADRGESIAVVGALADVQAEEDAYLVAVVQAVLPNGLVRCWPGHWRRARIHVMQTCRPPGAGQCARRGGSRTSDLLNRVQAHGLQP